MSSSLLLPLRTCVVFTCAAILSSPGGAGGESAPGAVLTTSSAAQAQTRATALRQEIARHDELYFRRAAPEISDAEYDRLKQELRRLEAAFPELADDASSAAVGDDRTGAFPTQRHREPMLSLDKAYSADELRAFHERLVKSLGGETPAYVIEPKFDGLAISVTYEHGRLIRAVTRGNGVEGDDVTANVRTIVGLPHQLRPQASGGTPGAMPALIELRGEIYVSFAEFSRINAERDAAGEPLFANPRNLAAGTLKQRDPRAVATRRLEIVFYGCGAVEPADALPATQQALQERIAAWGLPGVPRRWSRRAVSLDELSAAVQAVQQARRALPFPIDGAVVKLDSLAAQRALGAARTAPRWALAYKFTADRAETQVVAIELQVGRTGVITPVARLAPVELGGSTISRATLHNAAEIARRDIRVGDTVAIEKAGEIIPSIVGVNLACRPDGSAPFTFPSACPECATPLRRSAGEVAIRCPNSACPAQLQRRLAHFASRECVDIKGLGTATIDALVTSGQLRSLADLYRLRRDDLLATGRGGEKTADALLAAIDASRHAELWRFIHGLGIPGVGAAGAQALAKRYATLDALVSASPQNDAEIAAYFAEPANRALIADLAALGVQPRTPETVTRGHLAGRTFVLTGTLPSLTRTEATARIEAAGGQVSGRVNERTDYVVVGAEPGAKRQQAVKAGIPILDEAGLLRLLEDGPPEP
ncbi:MAG TPA: NAD-dependent DNA ligase LigA [Opitutaceae bacterium]